MGAKGSIRYPVATAEEVVSIVGNEDASIPESWLVTNARVFYKNDLPYGLVSVIESEDDPQHAFIASTVTHPDHPFTLGMVKYILSQAKEYTISVITDEPAYQDAIRESLSGHGFEFVTDGDVLYSTKEKL